MSDPLEDYLRNQRENLKSEAPDPGHEDRFLLKLQKEDTPKKEKNVILRIAAVLAILLGGITIGWWFTSQNQGPVITADSPVVEENVAVELPPELAEVDAYYQAALDRKLKVARQFKEEAPTDIADLEKRLQDLETEYQSLKKELVNSYGNDRLINSMIRNCRMRVTVIDKITQQLEKRKALKQQKS